MGPNLHFLFDYDREAAARGAWRRSLDYFVWMDVLPLDEPPLTLWERTPAGVVRIPNNDDFMHIVHSGSPHHLSHIFGYWRCSDADIIFVRSVQPDGVYYALVLGGCTSAYTSDRILWICPQCGNELVHFDIKTGSSGWNRFWKREAECVEAFNSDVDLRTCKQCGHVHPLAYRMDRTKDSAEEAEARKAW